MSDAGVLVFNEDPNAIKGDRPFASKARAQAGLKRLSARCSLDSHPRLEGRESWTLFNVARQNSVETALALVF
ncbi:Uncharacterised protein [Legionella londiniensis]|uniref:Uncharacterized protein n=1 Tax=Legionella londiniensis TaxID=45068 RepID=A0A0W0VTB6_9GAMM|nr:hypothetical protein Llon_0196 [Legionella londiniensis]STX94134.1 Uncharacterised protein [Legionella londiniensis]